MTKKRVIVVGGGFAGLRACRELPLSQFHVTLVDSKDFFENVPGALRNMVEPHNSGHNLVPYPSKFNPVKGLVVSITSDGSTGEVELQSGEKLGFDYAILATGSAYPGSTIKPNFTKLETKAGRVQEFQAAHDQIKAAATVVIVGGGTVGVELAAEVVDKWPEKKVTVITSASRLLERMAELASKYCTEWLTKRGVEVICGERITDWGGADSAPCAATLTTQSGRKVSGDWVIKAVGQQPASAAFAASLGKDKLARNGSVLVDATLQVVGLPNVFAAGDVTAVAEEKTAYFADLNGMVAAHNIMRLERGEEVVKYPEGLYGGFTPADFPAFGGLSLGPRDGVFISGDDLQTGPRTARIRGIVEFVTVRMAAGRWLWGKASNLMKSVVVKQLTQGAAALKKQRTAAAADSGEQLAAAS